MQTEKMYDLLSFAVSAAATAERQKSTHQIKLSYKIYQSEDIDMS